MECRDFNAVLIDLVCERSSDTAVRRLAFAHAAQCKACAQQLAVQQELTARMLEFSRATDNPHLPGIIKEQLRAACDVNSRADQGGKLKFEHPASFLLKMLKTLRRNRVRWALATVAAMIFILFISTAVLRHHSGSPVRKELAEDPPALTNNPVRSEQPGPTVGTVASRRNDSKHRVRRGLNNRQIRREADQAEVASEFFPLTPAMDQKAIENGMIVRLEVSRSKLIAMGLPLHMEGDRETINTEVVMGDNGVAYAIRVVR